MLAWSRLRSRARLYLRPFYRALTRAPLILRSHSKCLRHLPTRIEFHSPPENGQDLDDMMDYMALCKRYTCVAFR
jgi:hypothetical protein